MKIICNTQALNEAAMNAQRAVLAKTSMSVLEGLLFTAFDEDKLKICGYDQEIGIETQIEAEIIEPGAVIINAKTFCNIIRHIPYEKVILEADEKFQCKIYAGDIEYSVSGIDSRDYPELPIVVESKDINISSLVLKDMIRRTVFSVAVNDVRIVHKGIKFEITPGELKLVAIDSHRIAIRKEFINYNGDPIEFIVPGKTLNEIVKMISDDDKFIKLELGNSHIVFRIDNYTVISRLLIGEFMKYNSIIPREFFTSVKIKTDSLIESVERVSLIITDRFKAPLRMEFRENELKLSAVTALGTASERIEISTEGNDLEIGVQSRFILEALRAAEEDEIYLNMINKTSPICIMPVSSDAYFYLILPVRLQ